MSALCNNTSTLLDSRVPSLHRGRAKPLCAFLMAMLDAQRESDADRFLLRESSVGR